MITELGSIIVEIIIAKNSFFTGNLKRANPYATKEQESMVKRIVGVTIFKSIYEKERKSFPQVIL